MTWWWNIYHEERGWYGRGMGCYCLLFLYWHSAQCCGVPPSDSTCSQAWWGMSKLIASLLHAYPSSKLHPPVPSVEFICSTRPCSCCRRADSSNFAGVDKFGTITLSFCWIILPRRGNVCVWTFWISCLVLNHCLSSTFKYETAIFQILGLKWIDLIELWHAMAKQEMSLELSLEDVKKVASQLGLILKVWSSR